MAARRPALPGRTEAIERLRRLVAGAPGPVVVWGPPGIGKTALVRAAFPDHTLVDASRTDEIPDAPTVVWDGVAPEVAAGALPTMEHAVVLTMRTRPKAGRSFELGPLRRGDAIALLMDALADAGHTLDTSTIGQLALPLDGVPLLILEAARWFDLLGEEGLAAPPDLDPPAHLVTMVEALDTLWTTLSEAEQTAASRLAVSRGPVRPALASALLGNDGLATLRTLRDLGWLTLDRPGAPRMLNPIRDFVLCRQPAAPAATDNLVEWLFEQAVIDWPRLDLQGVSRLGDHLDDLWLAVQHRPDDPRVSPALSILTSLRPTRALRPVIDGQLQRAPDDVDLQRCAIRLLVAAGELDRAAEAIERLCERTTGRVLAVSLRVLGEIAHRQHRHADARQWFERSRRAGQEAGDARSIAQADTAHAALEHDTGSLEDARDRYLVALDRWRELGDPREEGVILSNLGLVYGLSGDHERARQTLARAVHALEGLADDRILAAAHGTLGWVCFIAGDPLSASRSLRQALSLLRKHREVRIQATFLAQMGAALASSGETTAAMETFERAEVLLARAMEPQTDDFVQLLRGFLDLELEQPRRAAMRLVAARRSIDGQPSLVDSSSEANSAAELLETRLFVGNHPLLFIGPEASWMQPPHGTAVDLERFTSARRVLLALAHDAHGLSVADLFEAGWPGEKLSASSMRNRVHVVLNKLRAVGLKELLRRDEDGYHLDPDVPVVQMHTAMPAAGGPGDA